MQMEYRPVTARLRPPRFAVAYRTEADWIHMARGAVALTARVWGAGGVVLPVQGRTTQDGVDDALLPLLAHYDPDHVAGLLRTLDDAAHVDPSVVSRMTALYGVEGEDQAATWRRLRSIRIEDSGWEKLGEQIDAWCSPFKGVFQDSHQFQPRDVSHVEHGHTSSGHLATVPSPPGDRMYTLDLSQVDSEIALMLETRIGAIHADARPGLDLMELPVAEKDLPALVHLAVSGQPRPGWQPSTGTSCVGGQPDGELTASDFLASTPYGRAARWTTRLTSYHPQPVVWVVGDTAEDHALAVLCDRLYKHSAWIPTSVLTEGNPLARAVKGAIRTFQPMGRSNQDPLLLTSVSQTPDWLEALAYELNEPLASVTVYTDSGPSDSFAFAQLQAVPASDLARYERTSLITDPVHHQITRRTPVAHEAGTTSLLTPLDLPSAHAVEHLGPDLHWCVDVLMAGHTLPARTALPSASLTQETGGLPDTVARTARGCVSFISANMGFSTPANRHAQPLLRFPAADVVLEEVARARAATVKRSSAGRRAAIAVEMWGSLEAVAADLSGPTRDVLNSFLPPDKKRDGDYGPGYAIRGSGYVALEDIEKALRVDTWHAARDLADRLLARKVLRRGLLLNCERCSYEAFYRTELISDAFDCEACGYTSAVERGRWYGRDPEPCWYYALDQVVRDLLKQNGDVPLLAAHHRAQGSGSVLWSPELEVTDDSGSIELDLCLIVDGRIVVGEAKSNNTLKAGKGTQEAAARLAHAAYLLSADEVILATSKSSWARGTRDAVAAAVESRWGGGPRPVVTELVDVGVLSQ
ncbi:hypothetical protein [Streptomyces virginiae]|uniref:hypothetical protein n=1 Tax=Streptomyces virginiae TaxID=1961 RepID=UPI0032525086